MSCGSIKSQFNQSALYQPSDRNLALMALAIGISLLAVAALLQGAVATRTDFIATYRSSIPGDFSIDQRVTEFIDPASVNNLLLMSVTGGIGGALLLTAALLSYYKLRAAQASLKEAKKGEVDAEKIHVLKERIKALKMRLTILVPATVFLITLCVGASILHAKSANVTFAGDTYRWDARYIWTYCGGWLKSGSIHASVVNTRTFEALQKAGAIVAGIGLGGALFSYATQRLSRPKQVVSRDRELLAVD